MAATPEPVLTFSESCPDCGRREAVLPAVLHDLGDDFDWDARDFDSFRQFMLEALAARFPERKRWTPADVEVALAETLAAQLDKLSDMLDRVAAEFTLETARRPETVRRLLNLIGYDALRLAVDLKQAPFDRPIVLSDERSDRERLEQYWLDHPEHMDLARQAGPRAIRTQRRMVTLEDFSVRLEEHPLVKRAHAWQVWSGSWTLIRTAIIPAVRRLPGIGADPDARGPLDVEGLWPAQLAAAVTVFHASLGVPLPDLTQGPSLRAILQPYLDAYRMTGQAVELADAQEIAITMSLSLAIAPNYHQSEVRRAIEQALGTAPGGFFELGRLRFGEDLWASDIVQILMALDGVENVCINRFKRLGDRWRDMASVGQIALEGLEVAICDNEPGKPERGYYRLVLHGGRKG